VLLLSIWFPNLVLRANNFFYSYVVLAELEERHVASNLRHRPSSVKEFNWLPFTPPLVALFGPSLSMLEARAIVEASLAGGWGSRA
jgi:hypothetical protein